MARLFARIRSAIAFFLYATQREEWIEEFMAHVETLTLSDPISEEEYAEHSVPEEEDKGRKKCHLRLVK